jgi:hypothetical protein
MRRVTLAFAAGLALLVAALCVVMLRSPLVVASKNWIPPREERIARTEGAATYCQDDEVLPAHTSAIRLSLSASTGPSVRVSLAAGGREVASGARGSGWTGRAVTVALRPLRRTLKGVTVCVFLRPRHEHVVMFGERTPRKIAATDRGRALPGRMSIEYLRPGSRSWASLAISIARRMGLGRAAAGTWNALLVVELLTALAILACTLAWKELRR